MPEIRDFYAHVRGWDAAKLHQRKAELLQGKSPMECRDLDDEVLAELLAITRELRKHTSVATKRSPAARKPKADKESLDALV